MRTRSIFQTLEDRGNADEVEASGPFPCNRKDAWLGSGYYFWESFINNAHWWGKVSYRSNYIICKALYHTDDAKCLDLMGSPEHLEWFEQSMQQMKNNILYEQNTPTIARVLEFLKSKQGFPFEAVRAKGEGTRGSDSKFSKPLFFNNSPKQYQFIDLCPPIQICFFKKTSLSLSNYKIIYPDEYADGYGI